MSLKIRDKPPAKYRRDPEMVVLYRTVSRPLRVATRLLYDPFEDKFVFKKRVFKKGKTNDKSISRQKELDKS